MAVAKADQTAGSEVVVHDTTIGGGFNFPVEDGMATTLSDEKTAESLFGGKQELRKRSAVFVNRPQTPPTPDQTTPLPVELPGSILLPSQGFSQADPPVTPARDKFQAPSSEVSTRSSVPSLDTSSTTDTEMDMFKNLTSPQKRSHRSKTFSSSPTKSTSKPFTAMSAEELMRCLPHLNMSVITGNWAPAMEVELKRIKGLLQGAAEVRLDSQADLKSYAMDVGSIAVSARDISRTYSDAIQKVRALADQDGKAVTYQLDVIQAELQGALAVIEENKSIISDKNDLIQRLHETIAANARTFGGFIQDHVGSRLNNLHDVRTREVLQLIENQQQHPSEGGAQSTTRYVRIPEQQYTSYLQNLHDTQQKVETYSKIIADQVEVIKCQSAGLDKRIEGYREFMAILEKRHDRIRELETRLEANERELNVVRKTVEDHQALKDAHQILGKRCTRLEWTLQSMGGTQQQLEDRDTEIFALRQQLGNAVMEVAAQKTEAKAAIPQPVNAGGSSRFRHPLQFSRNATSQEGHPSIHARRSLLGGKLPASQSMLSLSTSQTILAPDKLSAHRNTPSPLSDTTRRSGDSFGDPSSSKWFSGLRTTSSETSGHSRSGSKWLSGLRMNPPHALNPAPSGSKAPIMIRPRKESLHATTRTDGVAGTAAASTVSVERGGPDRRASMLLIDREKALPRPPPLRSDLPFSENANGTSHMNHKDDQSVSMPIEHVKTPPVPDDSPQRKGIRVLSGITERSFEDGVNANDGGATTDEEAPPAAAVAVANELITSSPTSTSSSDKNAFRSSIAMLDRFYDIHDDDADADADVDDRTSPVRLRGHGNASPVRRRVDHGNARADRASVRGGPKDLPYPSASESGSRRGRGRGLDRGRGGRREGILLSPLKSVDRDISPLSMRARRQAIAGKRWDV